MKKHSLFIILLALMLILGCSGDAETPPSSAAATPEPSAVLEPAPTEPIAYQPHADFVWEVSGGQSTVYLMGSMHIVKPDYAITPEVEELFLSCDALAVESDTSNAALMNAVDEMSAYPEGDDITNHLSERGIAHFNWLCEQYRLDAQVLSAFKPFMVSSIFEMITADDAGLNTAGVDDMMMNTARDAGMPVLELEDGIEIYSRFFSLPDDTMERTNILSIPGPETAADDLKEMYELYISGNEDGMLVFLEEEIPMGGDGLPLELEEKDDLYEQYMMDDRNAGMADRLAEWLETPDRDVFTVAGLAHFLGEDSVIDMLEGGGYKVTRLDIQPGVPDQVDEAA